MMKKYEQCANTNHLPGIKAVYFLFENRQSIGFDQTIKNTGLLIWHIDDGVGGNTNDWHRRVDLEQADGLFELNYGSNDGEAADVWPGTLNKT